MWQSQSTLWLFSYDMAGRRHDCAKCRGAGEATELYNQRNKMNMIANAVSERMQMAIEADGAKIGA